MYGFCVRLPVDFVAFTPLKYDGKVGPTDKGLKLFETGATNDLGVWNDIGCSLLKVSFGFLIPRMSSRKPELKKLSFCKYGPGPKLSDLLGFVCNSWESISLYLYSPMANKGTKIVEDRRILLSKRYIFNC